MWTSWRNCWLNDCSSGVKKVLIPFLLFIAACNPAQDIYETGLELLEQGDIQAAWAAFDEALAEDPEFAPAYLERGQLALDAGDESAALADFEKAIQFDSDNPGAYANQIGRAHV